MATSNLVSLLQPEIELLLGAGITGEIQRMDPFGESILSTRGVTPREMSQGYDVRKVFTSGVAGVVEKDISRDLVTGQDRTTLAGVGPGALHAFQNIADTTWPDGKQGRDAAAFEMTIPLQAYKTTLRFTSAEFRINNLQALIHDVIVRKITGWARNIARFHLNDFWTDNASFAYAVINGVTAFTPSGGVANGGVEVTVDSNSVVNRLETGMAVDIYSADGATRRNETAGVRDILVVNAVDSLHNKITLVSDVAIAGVIATDIIVSSNSSTTTVSHGGLNQWIQTGGTLAQPNSLFGVNLIDHPELQSLVTTGWNQALTEQLMNAHIATWRRAFFQFDHEIDTAVTTWGVLSAMSKQYTGLSRVDRTGSPLNLRGLGVQDGVEFVFDGANITFRLSNFCQPGTCYIVRTGSDNWVRYVPPRAPSSESDANMPSYTEFEFLAPQVGWPSARWPVISTTAATDGAPTSSFTMPGFGFTVLAADKQPSAIKISGLTEDYVTAT